MKNRRWSVIGIVQAEVSAPDGAEAVRRAAEDLQQVAHDGEYIYAIRVQLDHVVPPVSEGYDESMGIIIDGERKPEPGA